MSITVHHLANSRSFRILWMLEELGLPYTLTHHARDPKTMRAPRELRASHPLGRAPQVEVDGRVLAESGAVLEYFVEREGALRPTDPDALVEYRFFLHYAEGSVMAPLLLKLVMSKLREVPFFLRPLTEAIASKVDASFTDPEIANHFRFIDQTLGGREFFAGSAFSAADIQMVYPVQAGLSRGSGSYPNAAAWLARMRARPAFIRALETGGSDLLPG
ncbi:MAG: glutathione S-transferase [Myxococcota bacterium]|jgi:glutathione S-transferase